MDVNTRLEFNVIVRVKVEVEWRLRQKLSRSSDIKVESKVRSRLVSIVIKVDIRTKEYNLNSLFEYSKSVAESGSIIIMVPT